MFIVRSLGLPGPVDNKCIGWLLTWQQSFTNFQSMKPAKENMLAFQVPPKLKQRLRVAAAKRGILMSAALREALVDWLKKGK